MLVSGPTDDPAGGGASRHIRKDPEHKTAVGALGAKLTAGKSGVGEPEKGQLHSPGKPFRLARHSISKTPEAAITWGDPLDVAREITWQDEVPVNARRNRPVASRYYDQPLNGPGLARFSRFR